MGHRRIDLGTGKAFAYCVPGCLWADQPKAWDATGGAGFVFSVRLVLAEQDVEGRKHPGRGLYVYPTGYDSKFIEDYGLLYTDPTFAAEVQALLYRLGHNYLVEWSEQGLQGLTAAVTTAIFNDNGTKAPNPSL